MHEEGLVVSKQGYYLASCAALNVNHQDVV